jgi:small redox-active disulfide protein 2
MPINIKVLGPGCNNCHLVEEHAREAVAQLGLEAEIEHVTDRAEYPRYGLLFTPGLVIDGKLISGGRIPSVVDISAWLESVASRPASPSP